MMKAPTSAAPAVPISRLSAASSTCQLRLKSSSRRAAPTTASAPRNELEEADAPRLQKPRAKPIKYDKHCLHDVSLEEAQTPHWPRASRMSSARTCPPTGKASFDDVIYGHVEVDCATLDDNVLIKADGLPTYNFANVVDDHLMGDHATSCAATEYLSSAPKYNLLYEAFGWTPPTYVHLTPVMCRDIQKDKDGHPVLDENGQTIEITRKMSKRKGDPSVRGSARSRAIWWTR